MDKVGLIKRNCVEIINEDKIEKFRKKGVVYCGYECSGEIHLGHLVTILKLLDLQKAGIKVKILLADWHTWLNKKGDWKFVNSQVGQWEKGMKAIGLKAEFIKGTSFQKKPDYVEDVLKLA
ncbi:MAG TPA: tyrosine--tRNA ligase, partial [Bacillota bacterium]|nr:tyrosine--tRNA ligase [Bacillota bacterium]